MAHHPRIDTKYVDHWVFFLYCTANILVIPEHVDTSSNSHAFGDFEKTIELEVRKMGIFIFALVVILVFTALAMERILKDIRDQNKEIIRLLKEDKSNQDANTYFKRD